MARDKVRKVLFSDVLDVRVRVINSDDSEYLKKIEIIFNYPYFFNDKLITFSNFCKSRFYI